MCIRDRLKAIREFTEFGAGFKVAMRDLEIRGAGNLLGTAQSGHMMNVGYELYCKMVDEAVRALQGEIIGCLLYTSRAAGAGKRHDHRV